MVLDTLYCHNTCKYWTGEYTLSTEKLLIWRIIFFIWEMDQRLRLNEIHMKSLLLVSKVSKFYLALIERWRTKMWKYIYLVQCTKIIDTFWKVSFICNNMLLFTFPPKLVHKSYSTMQQFAKIWIVNCYTSLWQRLAKLDFSLISLFSFL